MPEISKTKKIFLLIFALFFILILARFFDGLSFPNERNKFLEDGEATLYPNRAILQKFTTEKNNLNQVDVAIRNFNKWSRDKIIFELKDASCDRTLAKDELNFFSYDYTIYTPFTFPQFSEISNSEVGQYCAAITFVPKKADPLDASELPFIVYSRLRGSSFQNTGDDGGAGRTYDGKTLVMKPAHGSGGFFSNIKTLNDRVSQYKASFLKGGNLYLIAIFYLVLTIILTVLLIFI